MCVSVEREKNNGWPNIAVLLNSAQINDRAFTHAHTYLYVCVCVCVCMIKIKGTVNKANTYNGFSNDISFFIQVEEGIPLIKKEIS